MAVAAVATVLNEADIIGRSVGNLLARGVDKVYVALAPSTDGTEDVLRSFGPVVQILDDKCPYHDQPARTTELAQWAYAEGADWVLPFDADEFAYPCGQESIPAAFERIPAGVNKVVISRWLHRDWHFRHVAPERLPKVAWRTGVPFMCQPGNHDVGIAGGTVADVIHMRELQFRSYEHMVRKSRERVARIDPSFGPQYGTHQRDLAALDGPASEAAWRSLMDIECVYDPIPVWALDAVL